MRPSIRCVKTAPEPRSIVNAGVFANDCLTKTTSFNAGGRVFEPIEGDIRNLFSTLKLPLTILSMDFSMSAGFVSASIPRPPTFTQRQGIVLSSDLKSLSIVPSPENVITRSILDLPISLTDGTWSTPFILRFGKLVTPNPFSSNSLAVFFAQSLAVESPSFEIIPILDIFRIKNLQPMQKFQTEWLAAPI